MMKPVVKREPTMGFHLQKLRQNASKSATESRHVVSGAGAGVRGWACREGRGLRADGGAHGLNRGAGPIGLNEGGIKLKYLITCSLLCVNYTPNKAGFFLSFYKL